MACLSVLAYKPHRLTFEIYTIWAAVWDVYIPAAVN